MIEECQQQGEDSVATKVATSRYGRQIKQNVKEGFVYY